MTLMLGYAEAFLGSFQAISRQKSRPYRAKAQIFELLWVDFFLKPLLQGGFRLDFFHGPFGGYVGPMLVKPNNKK